MGCGGSSPASAPCPPPAKPVDGQIVEPVAPAAGGKGHGKGKGGGKQWQIWLDGKWKDYEAQEDKILKRAYLTGQPNAKFELRGQKYEYNFKRMLQINRKTDKQRSIRPPRGPKPPSKPLLPKGPMILLVVGTGQPGTIISVNDPNNPERPIQVFVPAHAKPGQKMAVPIPAKGEDLDAVAKRQQEHDKEYGTKGQAWTTGGKVAAGGAALAGVAAVGVGGVILGDHLAGGDLADTIGAAAVDGGEAAADFAADAADAVGDWAPGAADAVGDWAEGAADDAADWLGDAGEDIGGFVMDLF